MSSDAAAPEQDDGGEKRKHRSRVSMEFKEPAKRGKNRNNVDKDGVVTIDPSSIRFKTLFRNTIYDVMLGRGWKLSDADMDWDVHWAERDWIVEHFDAVHLENWQRVNHFRNDRELCRKDLLIKNVKRHKRMLEKQKRAEEARLYDFCPTTFVLPGEYALFVETFKKESNQTWIMKPVGSAQGRGIFLFRHLKEINRWRSETRWRAENSDVESYVVQRYINNPFLVGGKKFDIRIYALVTSFTPLTVWLYRGGFARFSAAAFTGAADSIGNNHMHLTNVAVQKNAEGYDDETGNKWDLRDLKLYLLSRFGVARTDTLFREIQDIVLRSIQCVENVMINDKHCFELYGYDVLFDDNLKPWLIEVNASPSLSANTREDYNMKYSMLNDMLDLVDVEKRRKGDETSMGGFDLIHRASSAKDQQQQQQRQHAGPAELRGRSAYTTLLGAECPVNQFEPPLPGSTAAAKVVASAARAAAQAQAQAQAEAEAEAEAEAQALAPSLLPAAAAGALTPAAKLAALRKQRSKVAQDARIP